MGGFIGSAYELTGAGAPFKARAERVTSSLFPILGIEPLLGRIFTQPEDDNAVTRDGDQLCAMEGALSLRPERAGNYHRPGPKALHHHWSHAAQFRISVWTQDG